MFGTLFYKECKEIFKSITYYIFLVCMILFFMTQMGEFEGISKPKSGQENYGYKYSDDESIIMNSTIGVLAREHYENRYTTYPVGFYKEVRLNAEKEKRITKIIEDTTGLRIDEVDGIIKAIREGDDSIQPLDLKIREGLTFEKFLDYMEEVDDILGGLGILIYGIVDNLPTAYMIPMIYYIISFGGGKKYLGKLYLFSMMEGSVEYKKYLLICGAFMIIFSLMWNSTNKFNNLCKIAKGL